MPPLHADATLSAKKVGMPHPAGLKLDVLEIQGDQALSAYYDLRWRVLREPWTQARTTGHDQREAEAIHLGCWAGGRLLGVGRLHFNSPAEAQVRFMAVEPGWEGRGIGGALLEELEHRALAAGAERMVLDARESARGFYERHGYRMIEPGALLFEQIAHWKMTKALIKKRKSQSSEQRPVRSLCDTPASRQPDPAVLSRSNRRP